MWGFLPPSPVSSIGKVHTQRKKKDSRELRGSWINPTVIAEWAGGDWSQLRRQYRRGGSSPSLVVGHISIFYTWWQWLMSWSLLGGHEPCIGRLHPSLGWVVGGGATFYWLKLVGDTALVNLGDSSDLVWENYPDKEILSQRKIVSASWGARGSQIWTYPLL